MSHPEIITKPVGILLAAGKSQRFGSKNKLLHPINNHASMLQTSLDNLRCVVDEVLVVINPELESYCSRLECEGVKLIMNQLAETGMASSLVCGVNASEDASGWLIALADMPYIKPATFQLLLDRFSADHIPVNKIILPEYKQKNGHPVIFSSYYKEQLLELTGDTGGRDIIQQHQRSVEAVKVDDPGVVKDIDTKNDIL